MQPGRFEVGEDLGLVDRGQGLDRLQFEDQAAADEEVEPASPTGGPL